MITDTTTTQLNIKGKNNKMNVDGDDVKVPMLLQQGTPMTKVSAKKKKTVMFRIDPDQGYILWESKKSGLSAYQGL